jgi:TRAP-type C4-dicarboxylate transport system substrate-binding protein
MNVRTGVAALAMSLALCAGSARAAELEPANLKVLGAFSNLNMSKAVEAPMWTKTIPDASGGKLTVDFTTLDQMGLQGTEVLRLVRLGVVDFASGNISYMSGDSPVFDGLDLAGVFQDLDLFAKAVQAYRPTLSQIMAERYNAKLLMVWPAPPQILYCRGEISGLADLQAKKIRSFSPTIADFIEGIGGVPIQIAFPEVIPALQRGAVDCGVTGTLSGNTARWWEVTDTLYPMVIGWAPWFTAVNINTWNRLPEATREFLETQLRQGEEQLWSTVAQEASQGIICNTGQDGCTMGLAGSMRLQEVTEADQEKLRQVARDVVLTRWQERCGADCVANWTGTVGAAIGLGQQ